MRLVLAVELLSEEDDIDMVDEISCLTHSRSGRNTGGFDHARSRGNHSSAANGSNAQSLQNGGFYHQGVCRCRASGNSRWEYCRAEKSYGSWARSWAAHPFMHGGTVLFALAVPGRR
jgi:hypothetical protein